MALYEALRASGKIGLRAGRRIVRGAWAPASADLPLNESAPLLDQGPVRPLKVAQEMVALELGRRYRLPTVVTRSFNHAGPGQRPVFAVPAFASRVEDVRRGAADTIHAGNVDVRRDISDVRDVVVAYRLLLEALVTGSLPEDDRVYNVASGTALRVREWIEMLLQLAGIEVPIQVDPSLVRPDDPIESRRRHSAACCHRLDAIQNPGEDASRRACERPQRAPTGLSERVSSRLVRRVNATPPTPTTLLH